jgi:hypothetical protein
VTVTALDYVFIPPALGAVFIGQAKFRAWLRAPAEHRPNIRSRVLTSVFAAPSFLVGAPLVGMNLDRVTGINSLSVLIGWCAGLGFVCAIQMMLVYWLHPVARAWKTSRWLILFTSVVVAINTALFFLGNRPAEHIHVDFPIVYSTTPFEAEFIVLHFGTYMIGLATVLYLCWRWSLHPQTVSRPMLRRGLRITAFGLLFPVAYSGMILVGVVGSWFGADLSAVILLAPVVCILGVPPVILGALIGTWEGQLKALRANVNQTWTSVHDLHELLPLWQELRVVQPEMVQQPTGLVGRWLPTRRLYRRVIELMDWMHQLAPYHNRAVVEAAREQGERAGLTDDELRALTEAAQLRWALRARAGGGAGTMADPQDDQAELDGVFVGAVRRLVPVAQYFRDPLSVAVVESVSAPAAAGA